MTHALLMLSGRSLGHEWQATGGVAVKGKGVMETFLWREPSVLAMSGPVQSMSRTADLEELLLHSAAAQASGIGRRISAPHDPRSPPVVPHSAPQARHVPCSSAAAAQPGGQASPAPNSVTAVVPLPTKAQTAACYDISRSLPSLSNTASHLPASMRSNLLRGHKSQGSHVSPFNAMTQIIFQLARDSKDGEARNMLLLDSGALDTSHSLLDTLHSNGCRRLHRGITRLTNGRP